MHHNIILRQLALSEMKDIYEKWMKEDFPPDELKKWQMIQDLSRRGIYEGISALDGDKIVGYAFFSIDATRRFYLLDYFAILKEFRGMGYGACMLKLIAERYKDADILLCEVENPFVESITTIKQQEQKRLEFYLKNNWEDTEIDALMYGVEYRLLNAKLENDIKVANIQKAYESIYRTAIPKEDLEPNMMLRMHKV